MRRSLRALAVIMAFVGASLGGLALAPPLESASQTTPEPPETPGAPCPLQTFGSHQYRTCQVGHPAETALAAAPNGAVWALSPLRPQKSTDAGSTWTQIVLTPPNIGVAVVPEGDVVVAENGDIWLTWLTMTVTHTAPVWVSTNGGTTFTYKPLTGPAPVPDRPWIMTSALSPADPSNPTQPNPYLAVVEAGIGAKPHYASGDLGTVWYPKTTIGLAPLNPPQAFPTGATNGYLNFAKPFGQGFPAQYLALANGQILDLVAKRMTYDFVHWTTLANAAAWPNVNAFPWWDSAADGTVYAVQIVNVGGTWTVKYKWFDGTWHDGATTVALTAQPDYLIGLTPTHVINAAVKSFGSTLGINTREGTNDVLIRITNANTASASATKERIGPGSPQRYDYPNLVFDAQGRAVTTYNGAFVAYAQSV